MRACRNVISQAYGGNIADAPQNHGPFTVLRRLFGVGAVELAGGGGGHSEMFLNEIERFGFFELAGDDQDDVVRLIELLVKRLQILNRNALDIAAVADR